jgi:hypothetical protein
MKQVVANVKLSDIDVEIGAVRRTKAGSILLEVDGKEKADRLSDHLHRAVGEMAKIYRPTRTTPVLVVNIPDWMDDDQVENDIRAFDADLTNATVRVRENAGGGRVAKLNVHMSTAARMAERGSIKIGWSQCRVKLLEHRKPKCHKCFEEGHLKAECKINDAMKKCFRCRKNGHLVATCPRGLPTDHSDPCPGKKATAVGATGAGVSGTTENEG